LTKRVCLVLSLLTMMSQFSIAQLTIQFEGLEAKPSVLMIAIYKSEQQYLNDERYKSYMVEVQNQTYKFTISDLQPGEFAFSVFQDLNGNYELDMGVFGQPIEPYAFSLNKRPKFGKPLYSHIVFKYERTKLMNVKLK
jgi:uncharacterized protein (DUF2141 family)